MGRIFVAGKNHWVWMTDRMDVPCAARPTAKVTNEKKYISVWSARVDKENGRWEPKKVRHSNA